MLQFKEEHHCGFEDISVTNNITYSQIRFAKFEFDWLIILVTLYYVLYLVPRIRDFRVPTHSVKAFQTMREPGSECITTNESMFHTEFNEHPVYNVCSVVGATVTIPLMSIRFMILPLIEINIILFSTYFIWKRILKYILIYKLCVFNSFHKVKRGTPSWPSYINRGPVPSGCTRKAEDNKLIK